MQEHTMRRVLETFCAMRTVAFLCCIPLLAWSPALAEDNPEGHTRTTTLTGTATNYGTISTVIDLGMSSGAGETSTNAGTGVIRTTGITGHGIRSNGGTAINSGSISTSGDNGYGVQAINGATVHNSGTITTSGNGGADGISSSGGGTIYNSGTVTALNTGSAILNDGGTVYNSGTASSRTHAIHAFNSATIHLQTGARILSGDVYGELGSNHLIMEGSGTVDFAITRDWEDVTKAGAGTWTFARGFGGLTGTTDLNLNGGTLAVNSGVTLNVPDDYVQAAGTTLLVTPDGVATPLAMSDTATLAGNLSVEFSANTLGATTILTAMGGLGGTTFDSVTAFNPNFSPITTTYTGISVSVSSAFTPQFDASSMGVTSTLAGAQRFATLASTRGYMLLADADGAGTDSPDGPVMVASAGSLAGLLDRSDEPDDGPRWGMYLQPMLASSSRDAVDGLGYDANMHGIEFGIDHFVDEDVIVGVMGGYASTRLDFKGSSFVSNDYEDQDMLTLGGYAAWGPGNWRITDVLSASRVEHDSTRNAGLGQTAAAHYSSWLISNQLRAAYAWVPVDHWEITPRLGLDVTHVSRGAFSETGAVNAVSYRDYDQTFWDGSAALRATRSFSTEHATFSPYAGIGYSRNLAGNDVTVRQYLPTTSAEVTTTNDDNRMTAEFGLTMDRDQFKTTLAYNGEFSQHTESHGLTATFRWEF